MPYKPARPCSYPGCPRLTHGRFCEEHQKQENARYERYDRDHESKKRYRGAWPLIRKRHDEAHPVCERCLAEGRITPVEHVHHIIPLSEGGTHNEDNLMSLCKPCHSKVHSERGDRWGRH